MTQSDHTPADVVEVTPTGPCPFRGEEFSRCKHPVFDGGIGSYRPNCRAGDIPADCPLRDGYTKVRLKRKTP